MLFGICFLLVRLLHLVLYGIVGRDDPDLFGALLRIARTEMLAASLLVVAGFLGGDARIAVWVVALAIDFFGPVVLGLGGWRIAPALCSGGGRSARPPCSRSFRRRMRSRRSRRSRS